MGLKFEHKTYQGVMAESALDVEMAITDMAGVDLKLNRESK